MRRRSSRPPARRRTQTAWMAGSGTSRREIGT